MKLMLLGIQLGENTIFERLISFLATRNNVSLSLAHIHDYLLANIMCNELNQSVIGL